MIENLGMALLITLIGMSLVFAAIILLWGLMALMTVRLPSFGRKAIEEAEQKEPEETGKPADSPSVAAAARAAALAVAVALARRQNQHQQASQQPQFPLPPTAIVSAWQAVNRTNILTKRGKVR